LVKRRLAVEGALNSNRTCCRRLRQRGEQVLASARPLNEQLQIKHFLAAIFVYNFSNFFVKAFGFLASLLILDHICTTVNLFKCEFLAKTKIFFEQNQKHPCYFRGATFLSCGKVF
jgi:hypothetical protein